MTAKVESQNGMPTGFVLPLSLDLNKCLLESQHFHSTRAQICVDTMTAFSVHSHTCHLSKLQFSRRASSRQAVRLHASHKVTVLPGDGIGPEIAKVALQVLEAAGRNHGEEFQIQEHLVGGAAIDATGQPLPEETLTACRASDAVLLAAIGGCSSFNLLAGILLNQILKPSIR